MTGISQMIAEEQTMQWRVDQSTNLLGIVGGLGPLASAEFLKTIYEHSLGQTEQETPRVIVYSDPTFPDRTEACLNGSEEQLLNQLVAAMRQLQRLGASQFVICCITIHHLLPRLPNDLKARLVSLVDLIFEELTASRERHLLLCTTGARKLKIFEGHELWRGTSELVALADEMDQCEIHRMIYRIKQNQDVLEQIPFVESLLRKYEVNSFIAGCTEIHLLAKHFRGRGRRCIDPLISIAKQLSRRQQLVG